MAEFAPYTVDRLLQWITPWVEVEPTLARFLADSAHLTSAAALGALWCNVNRLPPEAYRDGLVAAITTLWSHSRPHRPCDELIAYWIHGGFEPYGEFEFVEAATDWFRAWDAIRLRLGTARSCDAVAPLFTADLSLALWLPQVVEVANQAGWEDPAWFARGLALVDDVLARFIDEGVAWREQFESARGELLIASRRRVDGEAALRAIIARAPTSAMPYLTLAEALSAVGAPVDALAVLKQALAVPVEDGDLFALDDLAETLREDLEEG